VARIGIAWLDNQQRLRFSTKRVRREPAPEELLGRSLVDGLREEFLAPLIAPGVVDDQPALVFAEIDVGVVDVLGLGDALPLLGRELRVGDLLVLCRRLQHRIQRARLPMDQVRRAHHAHFVPFVGFQVEIVEAAVEVAQAMRCAVAVLGVDALGRCDLPGPQVLRGGEPGREGHSGLVLGFVNLEHHHVPITGFADRRIADAEPVEIQRGPVFPRLQILRCEHFDALARPPLLCARPRHVNRITIDKRTGKDTAPRQRRRRLAGLHIHQPRIVLTQLVTLIARPHPLATVQSSLEYDRRRLHQIAVNRPEFPNQRPTLSVHRSTQHLPDQHRYQHYRHNPFSSHPLSLHRLAIKVSMFYALGTMAPWWRSSSRMSSRGTSIGVVFRCAASAAAAPAAWPMAIHEA